MQENLEITLPDQITNQLNIFRAENEEAPVIMIFSAMGVKAAYYWHYAKAMGGKGIHVITFDQRGNGQSSIRPGKNIDFGYKEIVEVDYPFVLQKVRELFTENKIFVMGHSLGGQMGSMFAGKYPELLDGLILNATCSVYYKGWDGIFRPAIHAAGYLCQWLADVMGYFPGRQLNFGDRESKGLIHDWAYTLKTGKYKATGSDFDYENAMAQMTLPILALSYEGDLSSPKKAMKNLLHKFKATQNIEHHHLVHPQHSNKKYGHYSWVRKPEITLNLVSEWVKKLIGEEVYPARTSL